MKELIKFWNKLSMSTKLLIAVIGVLGFTQVCKPAPKVIEKEVVRVDTVTVVKDKIVYRTKTKKVTPKNVVNVTFLKVEKPKDVPTAYKISDNGKSLIKMHEGLRLEKYKDADGHSIGYGHYLQPGETFEKITQTQCDSLFRSDIAATERSINSLLIKGIDTKGYVFSQNFIDGFGDMLYNCGHGNVEKSEIYKALKYKVRWDRPNKIDEDLRFIASKVKTFSITVPAHKNRRIREQVLMAN